VLILNGKIHIHSDYEQVSLDMITQLIANELLEKVSGNGMSPEVKVMHQERLGVAIGLLPSLQRGLDVNVKFNDVSSFEYTPELDCFDAFSVPLFHGWVYDPQDNKTKEAIKQLSYNHLQFKLVEAKGLPEDIAESDGKETKSEVNRASGEHEITCNETVPEANMEMKQNDEAVTQQSASESSASDSNGDENKNNRRLRYEAKVIESFLEDTASQLTYAGLLALHRTIPEGSLCTFFRNNHFSTMLKRNGNLYLLVTDLGYANMPHVVWEQLDDIDGNTELLDCNFLPSNDPSQQSSGGTVSVTEPLIDPDYLMALQLSEQQQQQTHQQHQQGVVGYAAPPKPPSSQRQQHPPPHRPATHLIEDEEGIPVLITSSPAASTASSATQQPVASSDINTSSDTPIPQDSVTKTEEGVERCENSREHDAGNSYCSPGQSQLELDHQAALDLQTALQLQQSVNEPTGFYDDRGGGRGGGRNEQHHLQQALSPSQLDSYRQAELEYFRKKDSSSSKKKKDSGGQSAGCCIS